MIRNYLLLLINYFLYEITNLIKLISYSFQYYLSYKFYISMLLIIILTIII